MKKQVLKIFSMLSLAVMFTVGAVHANPAGTLKANIPFDFSVASKTLPAGVYTVASMTMQGVLRIRREDGHNGMLIQTQSVQARRGQDQTKLVFHRYGDRYFLAQVWTAGNSDGRELPKSRAERKLIKNRLDTLTKSAAEPEVVCIVAE